MLDSSLSKDSTIYSYKLVSKITHSYILVTVYWGILALFAFSQSLRGDWLPLLAAFPAAIALQAVLVRLCLWMMRGGAASVWGWRFGAVWNGVLPDGFAPLTLVRRIHRHTFWIGLAAIGLFYPWLPDGALTDLLAVHIWLLAPRSWMLMRFRRKAPSGWIRINARDTSCYMQ